MAGVLSAAAVIVAVTGVCVGLLLARAGRDRAAGLSGEKESALPSEKTATDGSAEAAACSLSLGEGLAVTEIRQWTGSYLEDGSDETVAEALAVTVFNGSTKKIRLLEFTLDDIYEFRITTLLPGDSVTVLEKNRASFTGSVAGEKTEITALAVFEKEPSMQPDVFEVTAEDGTITVRNISGRDIAQARVFYKRLLPGSEYCGQGDRWLGGITYTVTVPALAAGEEVTLTSGHYAAGEYQLLFVLYAGE